MNFDVIIIGAGPGGYVCAIRAAQLGFKTALIEKRKTLGGTCLNVGCIPSKALLDSSEHYHNAATHFETHGIGLKNLEINFPQMIKRKDEVVDQTCQGIDYLMKKNKVTVYNGFGSLEGPNDVAVQLEDKTEKITGKYIVLATGSEPITPAAFNYDGNRIITSTEALELPDVPESMVIIGGGVIGLELGSVYARLGTKVDVVEFQDRILPGMDKDCSKELMKSLKKLGIKFHLNHAVQEVTSDGKSALTKFAKKGNEEILELKTDYCLVAIGRKAFTDKLGLDKVGIPVDDRGRIDVNENLQTKLPHIYAVGDVIKGAMLAHKAEEEGMFVAEQIAGQKPHIHHHLIPGVVYTWPEVASVGYTEEELKAAGRTLKIGKFPYKALGRSRASGDTDGMVKVIADKETDEVLGVHMVGARVADIIAEATALMTFRASAEDVARICHPHPTYTEAFKEAALAATDNRALHI